MANLVSRRPHEMLESRLAAEWTAENYPKSEVILNARLGPYPVGVQDVPLLGFNPAVYMPTLRWADALILLADKAIIIEAKIKLGPGAVGQLLAYRELFLKTPEYAQQQVEPPELVALYSFGDEDTERLLKAHGITCVNYQPAWARVAYVTRLARSYR